MKDFPNLIFDFHHNSAMCSMPPCSLQICRCSLMSEKNKGTRGTLHSNCMQIWHWLQFKIVIQLVKKNFSLYGWLVFSNLQLVTKIRAQADLYSRINEIFPLKLSSYSFHIILGLWHLANRFPRRLLTSLVQMSPSVNLTSHFDVQPLS